MKIITNVTLFKCDHCKKEYKRKRSCLDHEHRCYSNPDNFRPCWGCQNLIKKNVSVQFEGHDQYGGYQESFEDKSVFYCSKLETFLQSPQTIIKGNAYDLGDNPVMPMPHLCTDKKPYGTISLDLDSDIFNW